MRGVIQKNKQLATTHKNFSRWLKHNFIEDMCVDNHYEVWQVDHVIPLDLLLDTNDSKYSLFVKSENGKDCLFSWYNTNPLLKHDNRVKSSKLDYTIITEHMKNLSKYMKKYEIEKDELFYRYRKIVVGILDKLHKQKKY